MFLDNADVADALAYHTRAMNGEPLSLVFVKTILDAKESVSVSATHELVEMLVDPTCARVVRRPDHVLIAKEPADPVEESHFTIGGVPVSNFIYPSYYVPTVRPGTKLDACGIITHPFEIAPGGYASELVNGQWTDVFGSEGKAARFAAEDRRLHRTERRKALIG